MLRKTKSNLYDDFIVFKLVTCGHIGTLDFYIECHGIRFLLMRVWRNW